jgi:glucose-6-phosphate 1-epimerase
MTVTMVEYGSLPAVRIGGPGGAEATVTLYGAHLVSWKTAGGHERLFCSARSALDGSRAIRGGVPVIFPQFAARGDGMRHGFARVSTWSFAGSGVEAGESFACFDLTEAALAPEVARAWPHGFRLSLRIGVREHELCLSLDVANSGRDAFAFSSALHTYFLADDLANVRIGGVEKAELALADKLDRIYMDVEGPLTLKSGLGALALEQEGFVDAVVWNPGAGDAAALADMEDSEYRHFVCIEPALLEPLVLEPGHAWHGRHRIKLLPA